MYKSIHLRNCEKINWANWSIYCFTVPYWEGKSSLFENVVERGKSGLQRKGYQLTAGRRKATESATETMPLSLLTGRMKSLALRASHTVGDCRCCKPYPKQGRNDFSRCEASKILFWNPRKRMRVPRMSQGRALAGCMRGMMTQDRIRLIAFPIFSSSIR